MAKDVAYDDFSTVFIEGSKKFVYGAKYERNAELRKAALKIHGESCIVCGFNFYEHFGEVGRGYIHIHHIKAISQQGQTIVNPNTDLVPMCPNCHAMAHRPKNKILSVDELRKILMR